MKTKANAENGKKYLVVCASSEENGNITIEKHGPFGTHAEAWKCIESFVKTVLADDFEAWGDEPESKWTDGDLGVAEIVGEHGTIHWEVIEV